MFTVLTVLSKLPLAVLYTLGGPLYCVVYYLLGYRKTVVYNNLRTAFPECTEPEIRRLAKQFYRNLVDVALEVLKALSMSEHELLRRVRFRNPELIEPYARQQQSLLLLAAHQCNWIWLLLAGGIRLPLPIDVLYKRLHHRGCDRLMLAIRSRFGAQSIAQRHAFVDIMKQRHRLRGLAMTADQTPPKGAEKYWTYWLNQETAFAVGGEKIAKITRYPVVFVGMQRLRRGYYEVSFTLLAEPPYTRHDDTIMARYVREVEQQIRAAPADWLWSHRKWKYKKPLYA
jgi:Kdo2-lipid IVA lauroyltransferase/acyltransferase